MASIDTYFSVLALFILFRETIEASIICGVLLQFLNRSKPALKRSVWYGVAAGVGVSIIFGVIFIAIYYTAKDNLFAGKNRDLFKGIISWIAAFLITILGFAMLRFLGWETKWKRKLAAAMAKKVPEAAAEIAADADKGDTTASDGMPHPVRTEVDATLAGARTTSSESEDASSTAVHPSIPLSTPLRHESSVLTGPILTSTSSSSAAATAADGKKAKAACSTPGGDHSPKKNVDIDLEAAATIKMPESSDDSSSAEVRAETLASPELDAVDRSPVTRSEFMNIFFLVFTTVVREGIESVVFLGGLATVKLTAIPLPAFVGILCGCLVGVFLYYSGRQVKDIKWLVIIMAVIIFFIAAGQVAIGTDALMRAGAFGDWVPWANLRPWYQKPMYDWSKCCADTDPTGNEPIAQQNRQRFFALARAIFGYQDRGTPTELIAYCSYWGLVMIVMALKAWQGSLLDADWKHTREMKRKAKEEEEAAAREAAAAAALEGGLGGGGDGDSASPTALSDPVALQAPAKATACNKVYTAFWRCTQGGWKPSFGRGR